MTITLAPDEPRLQIMHMVRNTGLWEVQLAPWALTMMAPGGTEIMPMPHAETGLLPNRYFTFWEYTRLNDPRLYLGETFMTLQQDPSRVAPFKLGYNNEPGWAAYVNRGQVLVKHFETDPDALYPDNGCSYETFTNDKMLEMEVLGPVVELPPDTFTTVSEEWELYPAPAEAVPPRDETAIAALLEQIGV